MNPSPSADEVDAKRKEAIKAKVGDLPGRKWVGMKGETRDHKPLTNGILRFETSLTR